MEPLSVFPSVSLSPLWCHNVHSCLFPLNLNYQSNICSSIHSAVPCFYFSWTHICDFHWLCHAVSTWWYATKLSMKLKISLKLVCIKFSSPAPNPRCPQAVMMCQGRSCSPADRGGLVSQTSPTTPSICGASWRTASARSSPKSPCL